MSDTLQYSHHMVSADRKLKSSELNVDLHSISITYAHMYSTGKHNLLDLGLISASRIRYRIEVLDARLYDLQLHSRTIQDLENGFWKKVSYLT